MIAATGIELRAGSRILLDDATFRVAAGDRVGPGRAQRRRQDDADQGARRRSASPRPAPSPAPARSATCRRTRAPVTSTSSPATASCPPAASTQILRDLREAEGAMASADDETRDRAMRRYGRLEAEFTARGGYAAESEAASIASSLGLAERVLGQPLETLSGGQRRRVELARILFSGAETLLLDEPTNHLDADSIVWLRDYLKAYKGGLIIISHDVELLDDVVNRVFHLDANRAEIDIYNVGLEDLPAAARDRRAPAQAGAAQRREEGRRRCWPRPTRCGPRPPRPSPRRTWPGGPSGCWPASRTSGSATRWPSCASPTRPPAGRRRSPPWAVPVLRLAGDLHRRRPGHRPRLPRRRPRTERRRQDHAAADPVRRSTRPTPARCVPGHGLKLGYYAQEHETLDVTRTVLENMKSRRPTSARPTTRKVLGSFLFSGDDVDKPAGVLSGGEKTRLALAHARRLVGANVLLLDEPTNNLDPASREEILGALRPYEGAVVLVTPRRGRRLGARAGAGAAAARRRRGPLGPGLPRPRRAGLTGERPHPPAPRAAARAHRSGADGHPGRRRPAQRPDAEPVGGPRRGRRDAGPGRPRRGAARRGAVVLGRPAPRPC